MEPTNPPTSGPNPTPELRRYWFAGYISGSVTLVFFMLLVILSIMDYGVPCSGRFPAVAVLALGAALGLSFIGGAATAEGNLPLPTGWGSPVKFAVAGGIASLIIVMWIGWFFYARDCRDDSYSETKDQKVERLLNEAWDLMAGLPGAPWVPAQGQLSLEARANLEQARRKIAEALSLDPRSERGREYRSIYLARSGRLGDAERELLELIRQSPRYARAYNSLGNILLQKGRVEESISRFREAVAKDPDYTIAYYNLGNALYAAGRFNEALAAYSSCLERDGSLAQAFNNRGTTYQKLHDLDKAVADYRQAISIEPRMGEAHESLGDALMELGRFAEAAQAYARAAELAPNRAELTQKLKAARLEG